MLSCQEDKLVLYSFLPGTKWQEEPDKDFVSELSRDAQKPSRWQSGPGGGWGLLPLQDAKVRMFGTLDPHNSSLPSAPCPEVTLKWETLGEGKEASSEPGEVETQREL